MSMRQGASRTSAAVAEAPMAAPPAPKVRDVSSIVVTMFGRISAHNFLLYFPETQKVIKDNHSTAAEIIAALRSEYGARRLRPSHQEIESQVSYVLDLLEGKGKK